MATRRLYIFFLFQHSHFSQLSGVGHPSPKSTPNKIVLHTPSVFILILIKFFSVFFDIPLLLLPSTLISITNFNIAKTPDTLFHFTQLHLNQWFILVYLYQVNLL